MSVVKGFVVNRYCVTPTKSRWPVCFVSLQWQKPLLIQCQCPQDWWPIHKSWPRNTLPVSKHTPPYPKVNYKTTPVAPQLWMLPDHGPPDPTLRGCYPIINWSSDYMETPASFFWSQDTVPVWWVLFVPSIFQQLSTYIPHIPIPKLSQMDLLLFLKQS